MSQMSALYEKVAADLTLQKKFKKIMDGAKEAGEEATGQALLAFAEEAGFSVDLAEVKQFFQKLIQEQNGELSDQELDMVAGGKTITETVVITALTPGIAVILAVSIGGDLLRLGCMLEKVE